MVLYVRRNIQLDVTFITAHVAFASTNEKTQNRLNRDGTLFLPGADVPHV